MFAGILANIGDYLRLSAADPPLTDPRLMDLFIYFVTAAVWPAIRYRNFVLVCRWCVFADGRGVGLVLIFVEVLCRGESSCFGIIWFCLIWLKGAD